MGMKQGGGPIFIVGSPRSGTSILTWCLGQHPNILPQEESGWLGEFAVDLGVQFRSGTLRGQRSQLSALGMDDATFFRGFGNCINAMVLDHRFRLERLSVECGKRDHSQVHPAINVSRSASDPKTRWVDGTPEYSYYIAGLRKLFPEAKFIHIVRDVRGVVDSMLNFRMSGGRKLVQTEQEAYEYWLGTVEACLQAERAYGPKVVHRLRYEDLVQQPRETIRDLLRFLGEPYRASCAEPLVARINSSCVPAGFNGSDPRTDANVLQRALQLSELLQGPNCHVAMSTNALTQVESDFYKRVNFRARLDAEYAAGQQKVRTLTWRLNGCGIALALNFLIACAVPYYLSWAPSSVSKHEPELFWLISSGIGLAAYAMFRRAGLRTFAAQLLSRWRSLGGIRSRYGLKGRSHTVAAGN